MKSMTSRSIAIGLALVTLTTVLMSALISEARADVPLTINYQGNLTDTLGIPVPDSSYQITFAIYDAAAPEANQLWTSGSQTIEVSGGSFTYHLGQAVQLPDDLFATDTTRYLGITIGIDPEIKPRTKLTSVPYAFHALRADTAKVALSSAVTGDQVIDGDLHVTGSIRSGNTIILNGTNREILSPEGEIYIGRGPGDFRDIKVGIGTKTPAKHLHIYGEGLSNPASLRLEFTDLDSLRSGSHWDISNRSGILRFVDQNGHHVSINGLGNLGIGTWNARERLQIGDEFVIHDGGVKIVGKNYFYAVPSGRRLVDGPVSIIRFNELGDIGLRTAEYGPKHTVIEYSSDGLMLKNNGRVGIGTANPGATLEVEHLESDVNYSYAFVSKVDNDLVKAIAVTHPDGSEDFVVYGGGKVYCREMTVTLGAFGDFVFDDDYQLRSLDSVEAFIKANRHLPDVPSEKEVVADGLNLGEMDVVLIQKIEELTLYLIEQDKKIEELQRKLAERSDQK